MMFRTAIGVDFDGTVVDHKYPDTGEDVPGAVHWMRKFAEAGASIILWTMRSGVELHEACEWFAQRGIPLYGVNENPTQKGWTSSPKAYCQVFIDDAAACCPLKENPRMGGRPYVDWDIVGPWVMKQLSERAVRI
jgi:hypothetical protein